MDTVHTDLAMALVRMIINPSIKWACGCLNSVFNCEMCALSTIEGGKFHHYCFVCKVNMITDHKPLMTFLKGSYDLITQATKNPTEYPSIQYKAPVKTKTKLFIAIHVKPQ